MTTHSSEPHPVLSSAQYIHSQSIDVRIDMDAVERTAQFLLKERKEGAFTLETWKQHELNPKIMDEKAVEWYNTIQQHHQRHHRFFSSIHSIFVSGQRTRNLCRLLNTKGKNGQAIGHCVLQSIVRLRKEFPSPIHST
jgi:hypothetical protein